MKDYKYLFSIFGLCMFLKYTQTDISIITRYVDGNKRQHAKITQIKTNSSFYYQLFTKMILST
jgi:hypothetical protein